MLTFCALLLNSSCVRGGDSANHLAIVLLVQRNDIIGAIFFPRIDARGLPHRAAAVLPGQDLERISCGRLDVPRLVEVSVHSVLDHFRHAAHVWGHDWNLAGYGFE